ncbi:hypothetical protein [Rummeliibacillus stabekisii]|uniref:hypothetical protein n=1 Tax=Rummeliibacillus stabekisii TaxID=241244 RepID=UPI00372337F6
MEKLNNSFVIMWKFILLNLHTILFLLGLIVIVATSIVLNLTIGLFILGTILILLAFMLNSSK